MEYMILPNAQEQFDRRCKFGITMQYMARYQNQDFHQNVSFKCTLEFRYALKLAMEKSGSRDLSSFIREHLEPVINNMLEPLERREIDELSSPVKLGETARRHYRKLGCRMMVNAIRSLLGSPLPSIDRQKVEIARVLRQYESEAKIVEESRDQPVILRAALASVVTNLSKIAKLLEKSWDDAIYASLLRLAAELPKDLSLDVSHGLDFLNDPDPSIDKAYAQPPRLDPEATWAKVRQEFSSSRPMLAHIIDRLDYKSFNGDTLVIEYPFDLNEKLKIIKKPINEENLSLIAENYFGERLKIEFEPDIPF